MPVLSASAFPFIAYFSRRSSQVLTHSAELKEKLSACSASAPTSVSCDFVRTALAFAEICPS